VTYIYTDGLGSPVARTDASGTVISRTRYEPYGYVASGVQPTIGFTGHVNDVDTGLTYMQQRYYDPVAGRFLSIDPVVTDANNGSSFNRYVYGANNPYRYVDPDGRQIENVRERVMDSVQNDHLRRQQQEDLSFAAGAGEKATPKPNKAVMTGNAYVDEATTELNAMALIAMTAAGEGKGPVTEPKFTRFLLNLYEILDVPICMQKLALV
jgi:RHS repeat-associated protein